MRKGTVCILFEVHALRVGQEQNLHVHCLFQQVISMSNYASALFCSEDDADHDQACFDKFPTRM